MTLEQVEQAEKMERAALNTWMAASKAMKYQHRRTPEARERYAAKDRWAHEQYLKFQAAAIAARQAYVASL